MIRETAMRLAFIDFVQRQLDSPKPVQHPQLLQRVARIIDAGSGLRSPRSKR